MNSCRSRPLRAANRASSSDAQSEFRRNPHDNGRLRECRNPCRRRIALPRRDTDSAGRLRVIIIARENPAWDDAVSLVGLRLEAGGGQPGIELDAVFWGEGLAYGWEVRLELGG